jgi:hypothetical protein
MPAIFGGTSPFEMDEDREKNSVKVIPAPLSVSPNKVRMRFDAAKEQAKVVDSGKGESQSFA